MDTSSARMASTMPLVHSVWSSLKLKSKEVTESMMLEMMAITAIVATSETMLMTNEATPTPLLPFSGETGWT